MNKNIIASVLILIVAAGALYFVLHKAPAPDSVSVSDTNNGVPSTAQKPVCYFKETKNDFNGELAIDDSFTSINYDAGGKVHGIINWIPGEKDSLVGTYTGVVEKNDEAGYLTRLNIVYTAQGEGITSKQQQIIAVGDDSIKTGTGEMVKGTDGIWKIKNMSTLAYDNPLPKVPCESVPDRFKKDYLK